MAAKSTDYNDENLSAPSSRCIINASNLIANLHGHSGQESMEGLLKLFPVFLMETLLMVLSKHHLYMPKARMGQLLR